MGEGDLNVEDGGAGSPALVFLHYFAGSSRSWTHVSDALSRSSRCVRFDLPGFGRSPSPPAYSVHKVAHLVAAEIARLQLDRYVLVGHSMGGKIAMACAVAQPPGLAGLVLVAPSPPSPEPMEELERRRLLTSHGDRVSAEQTLHSITRAPLSAEDAAVTIADNLLTSPEAWHWWLQDGSREDISDQVGRIACPVLVLVGSDDRVISPGLVDTEVIPRLSSAKGQQIPGCGHLLPLEAPQEVSRAISAFIT
jgi:pimeloyl-ACP methyl ester carboxylesterase